MYSNFSSKAFGVVLLFCFANLFGAICKTVENAAMDEFSRLPGFKTKSWVQMDTKAEADATAVFKTKQVLTADDLKDYDLVVAFYFSQSEILTAFKMNPKQNGSWIKLSGSESSTSLRPGNSNITHTVLYRQQNKGVSIDADCIKRMDSFVEKFQPFTETEFDGNNSVELGIVSFALEVRKQIHGYSLWLFKARNKKVG